MASPRRELVIGNRIFAHHGVLDAYRQLSIRDPENAGRFIMSRARAPELVTEDDLMTFNLEGEALREDERDLISSASFIARSASSAGKG